MDQIEEMYYTTIQKVSALTSQPYDGDHIKLSAGEIRDRIAKWTEGMHMFDIQRFRLSLRLGREIFWPIMQDLRDILRLELNKQFGFRGDLHQIGSSVDGIKVGRVFDFDFLYIIEDQDVEVRADEQQGLYRVFRGGVEIRPRQLNSTLADCMDKIMSDISLPWPLEHGGYAGPDYSGIRFNGPAVTLQIVDKRESVNRRVIPLDITPVFLLPETCQESKDVKGKIKNILQKHGILYLFHRDAEQVYVVSHPIKNLWQPTTAYVESHIIKALGKYSPVKIALQLTKALLYYQQHKRHPHGLPTRSDDRAFIIVALKRCAERADERDTEAYGHQLNTKMRYQHIYLSPEARAKCNEVSKSHISVNTAAIKHVILAHAAEIEGSYRGACGNEIYRITLELIRAAYRELASTESLNVNHAFLPLKISKFSILPYALKAAAYLTQRVQDESAAMLDTFLKDDRVKLTSTVKYFNLGERVIENQSVAFMFIF